MKLHPSLREFSDEQHLGLGQALRLRRAASEEGEDLTKAAKNFLEFWQEEDFLHLRKEEGALLPAMVRRGVDLQREPVARKLDQHAGLRDLVAEVDGQAVGEEFSPETLWDLAETLETHIRMEERELFPLVEEVVAESTLREVSYRLQSFGRNEERP